jgi:putative hydrolase of the HAD superfamily
MPYDAVLFDVDGMVITSPRFSARYQKDFGVGWDVLKDFFEGPFAACKLGKADFREELGGVLEKWRWAGDADGLMAYWFSGDAVQRDVVGVVRDLRAAGTRCFLATNQEKYRARHLRETLGFGELFDGLFVSCELGATKDDPDFFSAVAAALPAIPRERILFVDHEEKNLAAAASVGLATHAYHDFEDFRRCVGLRVVS